MKKILTMAMVIALAMIITNCDQPASATKPDTPVYSKEYWGEWVRMDTGDSWIITDNAITVKAAGTTDASPVTVTSLAKQSERVIKANSEEKEIYLFAARIANSKFTGKINIERGAGSPQSSVVPGLSRSTSSGGITVTVTNKNIPSLTATATTDAEGNFAVEEIIPGDEYTVAAGGQTVTVLPTAPDVDVGMITLTSGINFNTTIAPASGNTTDMMQMYAKESAYDSGHRYSFVITVHNAGTEQLEAAPFSLMPDEGLTILSQPLSPLLGTIPPGEGKEIPVTVACEPMTTDSAIKRISITLRGVNKIWNGTVSLRFNKQPVTFYIAAKSPVRGVIITPYSKAYQFSTNKISASYGNSYVTSVTLPWSKQDCLAVFSGATLATESSYSFGVNITPSVGWSQGGGLYAVEGEPANNTETGAVPLQAGQQTMGYLHVDDIDYYKISLGNTPPADPPPGIFSDAYDVTGSGGSSSGLTVTVTSTTSSSVSLSWGYVSGASQYRVERSTSSSFSSVTTNTTRGTSYTASGLISSTAYYFRVTALNEYGYAIGTARTVLATTGYY
jgi:hypothetical protein